MIIHDPSQKMGRNANRMDGFVSSIVTIVGCPIVWSTHKSSPETASAKSRYDAPKDHACRSKSPVDCSDSGPESMENVLSVRGLDHLGVQMDLPQFKLGDVKHE